jgi:hypothetical protein
VCLGNPQLQAKREKSDCVDGIYYSICGFDPCRRWWSTLALFWIAFAEKPIDSTELISAVTAAGKDHFPANSDLFAGRLSDPNEVELDDILSKSLIISEAGRITPSSEEAKTVLMHIVSDPGGTDEGAIHELIAYTCLRCIERYQPTSIFRPWTIIESYLDHQSTSSRLLLYAASFWHVHFRLAEGRSRRLSALLHRIIQSVLLSNKNNHWGVNPDSAQIINVGMWLCTFHNFTLLGRVYLEMGADVTAGLSGTYPLHIAASKPSLGVLELILEKQPELEVVDREAMTPLQVAAFHGHVAAVKMLLAAGADVNKTFTVSRETTLHIAVRGGQEKIVALLLEQGAEVNVRNIRSESPLDIALRKGNYAIARMLVGEGASRLSCPAIEMTTAEALYAFQVLSLAEQGTSLELEHPQYVVRRPTRLNVHLNYR